VGCLAAREANHMPLTIAVREGRVLSSGGAALRFRRASRTSFPESWMEKTGSTEAMSS
jgi:hypothetical protein